MNKYSLEELHGLKDNFSQHGLEFDNNLTRTYLDALEEWLTEGESWWVENPGYNLESQDAEAVVSELRAQIQRLFMERNYNLVPEDATYKVNPKLNWLSDDELNELIGHWQHFDNILPWARSLVGDQDRFGDPI